MRDCFDEGVLQSFNDGELPRVEAERVSLHLTQCGNCFTALRELIDANELMTVALSPEFESAVPSERLRERIDAAIADVSPVVTHVQPSTLERVQRWFAALAAFNFRQPALAYGGLAAVLLFATVFGVSYFRNPAVVGPDNNVAIKTPAPDVENVQPSKAEPLPTTTPQVTLPAKDSSRTPRRPAVRPQSEVAAKVKLLPGEKSYLRTIAALDSTIKASDRPMRPALRAEYERNLALVDRALAAARAAAKNNPEDPDAAEFVFTAYQSKVDLLNTVADARVYNRQQ